MYIMMFTTYICKFSDKLQSHIQTFGLLLILSRFIGLPRYSYQPLGIPNKLVDAPVEQNSLGEDPLERVSHAFAQNGVC